MFPAPHSPPPPSHLEPCRHLPHCRSLFIRVGWAVDRVVDELGVVAQLLETGDGGQHAGCALHTNVGSSH